jgi:hypothetical protein
VTGDRLTGQRWATDGSDEESDVSPQPDCLLALSSAWRALGGMLDSDNETGERVLQRTLGDDVVSVAHLAHAPSGAHESVQERLQQAFNLRMLDRMTTLSTDGGSAPSAKDVVRLQSCSEEGGAWLRAIPANPSLTLKSGEFCAALSFRLHLPVGFLQRGGRDCQCQQHYQRRRWRRKRRHRKPTPVDAYGDHDMVCPLGNPHARHASVQSTYVRVGQDAGLFPRRTTVRELRRPGETGQKQADVAVDNYGPHMTTALVDFVMVHPTAATYVNNYGTSGDAAKIVAGKKVYKYGETCEELGYDLIPFAIETYGKFGKAALKHLKILQTMALEEGVRCEAGITPWFARSFVDGATQAIGVALQRSIVRDQLRRAHVRRSQGDACCDEGYSSSGSDSDGGQGSSVRASSQSSEGAAA